MQTILNSVTSPRWSNAEHTRIDCTITTSQFGGEQLPFTADSQDVEAHGRSIFAAIVAGEYGPIEEYAPPPPVVTATPPSGEIPKVVL